MSAFDLLDKKVQRWIYSKKWNELRDIQERAIPLILAKDRDLIIMAATAGGKTEAAFLPIISNILEEENSPITGFQAIYIGPLRALINDQFSRMEDLCADLDIKVTKWHGDVGQNIKNKIRKNPSGILLITPESLEAILVRHGTDTCRLFQNVSYVVIDEMHAFLGNERGKQLQSILNRIEMATQKTPVRIGLSATLANEISGQSYLRPKEPDRVIVLHPQSASPGIKLQLRGYLIKDPLDEKNESNKVIEDEAHASYIEHIFNTHRGHRCLIFASSRQNVETVTDALKRMTEKENVPEEFFAHHGNLSREYRENAEFRIKNQNFPTTIICTTTLELGIDIGNIDFIAQIGPGHTVSGMRQRLGRSGRRPGQSSILRVYINEIEIKNATRLDNLLRVKTIQTIAMINLLTQKWNELPNTSSLHLSTLLHQIIALISQTGGVIALQL